MHFVILRAAGAGRTGYLSADASRGSKSTMSPNMRRAARPVLQ
jgi:hypothetical protein